MTHQSNDNKEKIPCIDPVTAFDPAIVKTMQELVKNHSETLTYLSQFGSITERAKANLIFRIAAGECT